MNYLRNAAVLFTAVLAVFGAAAQHVQASGAKAAEATQLTSAPGPQWGQLFKPESSQPQAPGRAHTNYVLRSKDGNRPAALKAFADDVTGGPDATVETAETPCSLGHVYVQSPVAPCLPAFANTGGPSVAGYGAIAVVDAYDNPDAASDLAGFSAHFGLAAASFTKIYANGNGSCTTPAVNHDWALESSLDIEWAHVFAPSAAIVLVEACSQSIPDLVYAEQTAFRFIVANYPAGGQVSNSWGFGEFPGQVGEDAAFADFTYNGVAGYSVPVLAFASSGDSGAGVDWPSSNPWVVAAGGTSLLRNPNLEFDAETCWSGSGGGISSFETYAMAYSGGHSGPWADFQYSIFGQGPRATPDLSFDADPSSGVYVLSGVNGGWYIVGGTSVSSPSLASIVNRAGSKLGSVNINALNGDGYFTAAENNLLYSQLPTKAAYAANFYDVSSGSNGHPAARGYDLCTGLGTPRGVGGK